MKTRDIIIKALDINELEYGNMVMQNGYCWLYYKFCQDLDLAYRIGTSYLFWAWWRNQWEIRDRKFVRITSIETINEVLEGKTLAFARSIYNDMHNPHDLIIQPNVWVRNEISRIILQEVSKEEQQLKKTQNDTRSKVDIKAGV